MTPGEAAEQKANDGHAIIRMGKLACGTPCTSICHRHSLISLTATARLFFGHCWTREHRRVGRLPRVCVRGSAVGLCGCEMAPGFVRTAAELNEVGLEMLSRRPGGLGRYQLNVSARVCPVGSIIANKSNNDESSLRQTLTTSVKTKYLSRATQKKFRRFPAFTSFLFASVVLQVAHGPCCTTHPAPHHHTYNLHTLHPIITRTT